MYEVIEIISIVDVDLIGIKRLIPLVAHELGLVQSHEYFSKILMYQVLMTQIKTDTMINMHIHVFPRL